MRKEGCRSGERVKRCEAEVASGSGLGKSLTCGGCVLVEEACERVRGMSGWRAKRRK